MNYYNINISITKYQDKMSGCNFIRSNLDPVNLDPDPKIRRMELYWTMAWNRIVDPDPDFGKDSFLILSEHPNPDPNSCKSFSNRN